VIERGREGRNAERRKTKPRAMWGRPIKIPLGWLRREKVRKAFKRCIKKRESVEKSIRKGAFIAYTLNPLCPERNAVGGAPEKLDGRSKK